MTSERTMTAQPAPRTRSSRDQKLPIATLHDGQLQRRDERILDALKAARRALDLAAPFETLGKIDLAIDLIERERREP